ncbi:beta-1,4-N-acetylgalactosaminyltransferase 3-like [Actinia tenebrosa]|uniref:Beta-1,4-N-acetylgalactosaminyltransferase n=1 Tax=Actinia tenebrosa TaxID=6105 RepID=A0A6P8IRX2_ACTTE|nr:beta-1,4-N-acetylgalactosaminyltransferase 3-like [Actinia tenebrosa]
MSPFQKLLLLGCFASLIWLYSSLFNVGHKEQECFLFCQDIAGNKLAAPRPKENQASMDDFLALLQDCLKPTSMKLDKYRGRLNVHRWFDSCTCGYSIDRAMRIYSKFPAEPEFESTINSSEIILNGMEYSQRVFGYVTPEITGQYRFAVSSDDNSELWISRDSSPRNVELFASVGDPDSTNGAATIPRNFRDYKNQISQIINLTAGQDYYLEALHRNQGGNGHLTIAWQTPGMKDNDFTVIDAKLLSLYLHPIVDHEQVAYVLSTCPYDPTYIPKHNVGVFEGANYFMVKHSEIYPDDKTSLFSSVRNIIIDKKANHSDIYPDDKTSIFLHIGNIIINKKEVEEVVKEYMDKLKKVKGDLYKLKQILNVEKKPDRVKGSRYLLELELSVQGKSESVLLSEYVYKFSKEYNKVHIETTSELCYPEGMVWSKDTKIYIILPVLNYGYWVKYFIDELCKVQHLKAFFCIAMISFYMLMKLLAAQKASPNPHTHFCHTLLLKVTIKRRKNTEGNVTPILHCPIRSPLLGASNFLTGSVSHHTIIQYTLPSLAINFSLHFEFNLILKWQFCFSFTFLKKGGRFFKTEAINEGAATVKDPNSIIFLMDLHITVPPCFFDIIRKHTIKGKLCFFPMLLRLACSASDIYPQGQWDTPGYGLLSIFKQDWDSFGGEDVEKFRYRWGGEDWDLLDRVLNSRIETERFKWQKLFHFPHAKKGAWYNKG